MNTTKFLLSGLGLLSSISLSQAAIVTYTVDPAASSLTLAVTYSGIGLAEQAPGSLTDSFGGTITGDLSGSTLIFSGGSSIVAQLNTASPFAPAGSGTDNYGAAIPVGLPLTGVIAFRNIVLDINSGEATDGVASNAVFAFTAGHYDYSAPAPGPGDGSDDLVGLSTANAAVGAVSLSTVGSVETLTIPVTLTYQGGVGAVFSGQIVATRTIPEPASAAFLALGATLWGRRRRAQS